MAKFFKIISFAYFDSRLLSSMTAACRRSMQAHFNGFSLLAYMTDNEGNKFWDDYVSQYIVSAICADSVLKTAALSSRALSVIGHRQASCCYCSTPHRQSVTCCITTVVAVVDVGRSCCRHAMERFGWHYHCRRPRAMPGTALTALLGYLLIIRNKLGLGLVLGCYVRVKIGVSVGVRSV